MDAFGHVNNVVFFRYFESARIEYFRAITGDEVTSSDFAPILAKTECNYRLPVYFPDTLTAESAVSRVGGSSLTMNYRLTSQAQNAVVAEGSAVVVNVNPKTGKSEPLSQEFKEKIASLQGEE
jgi:acyl-CoA thioester hydrolase